MTTTSATTPMPSAAPAPLPRSRLRRTDTFRVGTVGLRTRPLRTALTALGIAIGIAAMIGVVGISASSRADLIAELDGLGTDLLRVSPGQSVFGEAATLPESARDTAARIGPVTSAAGMTRVEATVRRSPYIDDSITGGIAVTAADPGLVLKRIHYQSFLGNVVTERSLRKIEATDSSNDRSIARSAPMARPGSRRGNTTVLNMRHRFAPRLAAASESPGSMEL